MTSTSGGYTIGPSAHTCNPYGMAPASSTVAPSEQRIQRWNPYINGQNAYINQPISQYLPNQQVVPQSISLPKNLESIYNFYHLNVLQRNQISVIQLCF